MKLPFQRLDHSHLQGPELGKAGCLEEPGYYGEAKGSLGLANSTSSTACHLPHNFSFRMRTEFWLFGMG